MKNGTILCTGDLAPRGNVLDIFTVGLPESVVPDLVDLFQNHDVVVGNLESPLASPRTPILKTGRNFACEQDIAPFLKESGFDFFTLANNHILDQGSEGLEETHRRLDAVGIEHFGTGQNIKEALQPKIRIVNGVRVALLGMADHEFSLADTNSPGAAPYDPIAFLDLINQKKSEWDHLIVLLHMGTEHYPYPSPDLQYICRFLARYGASAVICQHSHCPGTFEVYKDSLIVYGQGNFYSPSQNYKNIEWHQGFMVQFSFLSADPIVPFQYKFLPTYQDYDTPGVRLMTDEESGPFLKALDERSKALQDPEEIKNLWLKRCQEQESQYLCNLMGYGKVLSRLERNFHFTHRLLGPKRVATLLNLIRCETHRESLLTLFESYYDEKAAKKRTTCK